MAYDITNEEHKLLLAYNPTEIPVSPSEYEGHSPKTKGVVKVKLLSNEHRC